MDLLYDLPQENCFCSYPNRFNVWLKKLITQPYLHKCLKQFNHVKIPLEWNSIYKFLKVYSYQLYLGLCIYLFSRKQTKFSSIHTNSIFTWSTSIHNAPYNLLLYTKPMYLLVQWFILLPRITEAVRQNSLKVTTLYFSSVIKFCDDSLPAFPAYSFYESDQA